MNKKMDVNALLADEQLDALAITEKFLSDDILDTEFVPIRVT